MKTGMLVTLGIINAALALSIPAQTTHGTKQQLKMADLPATVQRRLRAESWPGVILRVEKDGANYDAVTRKAGKETVVVVNPSGAVISRH